MHGKSRKSRSRGRKHYRNIIDMVAPDKGATQPEIKAVDWNGITHNFDGTPDQTMLSRISTGTNFYNRIGNRVWLKSCELRWTIQLKAITAAGLTPPPSIWGRVLLVYDAQPNGDNPNWANIIENRNYLGATDQGPWAYPNVNYKERFKIFMDKQFLLHQTLADLTPGSKVVTRGVTDYKQENNNGHIFVKIDRPTVYKANDNNVTAAATGSLVLLTYAKPYNWVPSPSPNGTPGLVDTNAQFNLEWTARVRYLDY